MTEEAPAVDKGVSSPGHYNSMSVMGCQGKISFHSTLFGILPKEYNLKQSP